MNESHITLESLETIVNSNTFPEVLYKYRDWNNPLHQRILTHLEVYFCQANDWGHELNIPFDFKYVKSNITEFVKSRINQDFSQLNRYQRRKRVRQIAKDFVNKPKEEEIKYEEDFKKGLNNRFGILALSPHYDRVQLWKKFGNQFNGFCVGFDARKLFNDQNTCNGAGFVQYFPKNKPPLITPVHKSDNEIFQDYIKQIFFLPDRFKNQDEFRIIKMAGNKTLLSEDDRKVTVNIEAYKEIIFGSTTPKQQKQEIKSIVKEKGMNIKFYTAKHLGSSEFKLIEE